MEHVTQNITNIASTLAILGAAWWFLYTTQFKPRIQFDLGCEVLSPSVAAPQRIVEVQFIFENKGFVEHRLYDLHVSMHGLAEPTSLKPREHTGEVEFERVLLPRISIVPKQYGYFFVRPGVRQVITHTVAIPTEVSVVRITSSFNYHKGDRFPHTARRVFAVGAAAIARDVGTR